MIIALAGRRVDALKADMPRFPLASVPRVAERIRAAMAAQNARALVCAAACGTDILALESAGEMGIRRRVVLPFARAIFRETSVVDRPGEWGPRFDRVLDEVEKAGDLLILPFAKDDEAAYTGTNHAILKEAERLAHERHEAVLALVVWDGTSRGPGDVTESFLAEARGKRLPVVEVSTL